MFQSCSKLVVEIFRFAKSDFKPWVYAYSALAIGTLIAINYTSELYKNILQNSYFNNTSMLYFALFYSAVYFMVLIPILLLDKQLPLLKKKSTYLKPLIFIVLYSISVGYFDYRTWRIDTLFYEENVYLIRIISQLKSLIIFFIPLVIIKLYYDKKVNGLYGIAKGGSEIVGYFVFFLLLLPFIVLASFTPDFQKAYPQFKPWEYEGIFNFPTWLYTLIFQISYAIDFIMTELMFRGALVIGLISVLNKRAVLPMVALYCVIHFGKPLAETVSSVFGGYILGALAYQTRHIWGGIIVHILIALAMEIAALAQYYK